jgi:hypothetical protein
MYLINKPKGGSNMIPIRSKKTDISSETAAGIQFREKIKKLSEEAANRSMDGSYDLNEVIADIALRENFNRMQIQRLVEESNTVAYNKRYDKLRNVNDRRITFPIASLDGVISEMGEDAPEEMINPNIATGGEGSGEINKAASRIESSYIHTPHTRLDERHQKYMEKVAAIKNKQEQKELDRLKKDRDSSMFKIANCLVMTERTHKNANEVYNTLISDVALDDSLLDGIKKKASYISEQLVKTRRSAPGFMVTLEENFQEKVADYLLGEYSLLKKAENNLKVEEVKIQPTVDVSDFNQLIDLARKLEKQHEQVVIKQPQPISEVNK